MSADTWHGALPTLRGAFEATGSGAWLMRAIVACGLDEANGYRLALQLGDDRMRGERHATEARLIDGEVDLIDTDWLSLARHRAAGLPLRRLIGMVLAPGLTLLMLMLLIAQFVAPPLEMRAERMRAAALSEDVSVDFRGGFWSRDGRSFLNVGRMLRGRTPSDVTVYDFDAAGRLQRYLHAQRASLEQDRVWRLQDV
ncbi:MAG: lipopolysaccharide export system permease protein, partial [Azoarcus sp.]|nr:lipopolysaccharide export system permease protein [Azoarcus sp.]